MGMVALVIMFAPAIGPTITGLVPAKFTWHYIFGYSCHSWFGFHFHINFDGKCLSANANTPVDWLSIVESSIGFAGIVVGTTMASDAGWLSLEVGLALLVRVIGLVFMPSGNYR